MDSIYHIETDIECKVLHFGKEICLISPGEDATILLRKGRHKLTFISTENPLDTYSITFEVPENDIEDFIEIRISPIRDERLSAEREQAAELERIIQHEEKQRALEIAKKEEEKRRRIQSELAEKELAAQREKERIERERKERVREQVTSVFAYAKSYDESFWGSWQADISLFPFYDNPSRESLHPTRIGFNTRKDGNDVVVIPLQYANKKGYPWNNRFHEDLVGVMNETKTLTMCHASDDLFGGVGHLQKYGYIDRKGSVIIPFDYDAGTPFAYDRAFVLQADFSDIETKYVIPQTGMKYSTLLENNHSLVTLERVEDTDNGQHWYRISYPKLQTGKWMCINKMGEVLFNLRKRFTTGYRCIPFPFSQGLSIALWIKNDAAFGKQSIVAIEVVDIYGHEICYLDTHDKEIYYDGIIVPAFTNGIAMITTKPYTYFTVDGIICHGPSKHSEYWGITRVKIEEAGLYSISNIYSRKAESKEYDDIHAWPKPKYQ